MHLVIMINGNLFVNVIEYKVACPYTTDIDDRSMMRRYLQKHKKILAIKDIADFDFFIETKLYKVFVQDKAIQQGPIDRQDEEGTKQLRC